MSIWWNFVTVLQLILPALSQVITTTCEIPSVEAGDDATLTIHFGEDLTQAYSRDFSITHLSRNDEETTMLNCVFSYGNVECDKTPCCTPWESNVTDVFHVYIHNASQQLEGKFWGFVIPADTKYQQFCNFTLKATTCPTNPINATNSHMTCNKQTVTVGQSCTVTCYSDNYFQENQTSVTYTCVGRNKWSPEIPVTSCEEQQKIHTASNLYFLFLLLGVIPIAIVMGILFKKRGQGRKKKCIELAEFTKETSRLSTSQLEPLLPINPLELQTSQQKAEDNWIDCIRTWYPDLQEKTYFLPPFHFRNVKYRKETVARYEVPVPLLPQDSDVRDDKALERVLQCLHTLADDPQHEEVMMVISQLQFGKYCGNPSYAAAVDLLPRPSPLPEEFRQHHYDKGDCDVLIIHSKHGLLTLEIRSVGENFSQPEMTEQEQDDVVVKEVKKAVKQLNRAEVVLKHLTSDIINTTRITKILVLPNISSSQLQRAINKTPDGKFLCQCLGVQNVDDAVKLCLLSDQLSDKHTSSDGNHSSHQALREWWQYIVKASGPEQLMTSSLYEHLVARFCSPATSVEVHCVTTPRLNIRTYGKAVSETGERVARLVLFPEQVNILNQQPPGAFLSGPPGTGKTIVLIMQGLTWLERGHDVHVVSTWDESRAVTIVIEHQLQKTVKNSTAKPRVHRHQFDFKKDGKVKSAIEHLISLSEGRQLCVIADEVVRDDRSSEPFTEFCVQLIEQVPGIFIWGASVIHDIRPDVLEDVKLTTPLRSPPVVVREVMEARQIKCKRVLDYTVSDVPVSTDGPPVMRIQHREGQSGHTGSYPPRCVECGHQIARVLTELDVGQIDDSNGSPPLQYRDVLVLCHGYVTDDQVNNFGQKTTTASGLVQGLRDSHVPVRVVKEGDEAAIRDMALGVGDLVNVVDWDEVQGLERKVVVVVRGNEEFDRLRAMSRCTSQLVLIDR